MAVFCGQSCLPRSWPVYVSLEHPRRAPLPASNRRHRRSTAGDSHDGTDARRASRVGDERGRRGRHNAAFVERRPSERPHRARRGRGRRLLQRFFRAPRPDSPDDVLRSPYGHCSRTRRRDIARGSSGPGDATRSGGHRLVSNCLTGLAGESFQGWLPRDRDEIFNYEAPRTGASRSGFEPVLSLPVTSEGPVAASWLATAWRAKARVAQRPSGAWSCRFRAGSFVERVGGRAMGTTSQALAAHFESKLHDAVSLLT